MNCNDQTWLENRISAAIADDFYLDRGEEKRIKEEAASRGISIQDTEMLLRVELDKAGAACERLLVEELDRLLHLFTDNDRFLDAKEERDALDKVLVAAKGKKVGLDPRVAQEYVDSFCVVNGIKRAKDSIFSLRNILIVAILLGCTAVVGFFFWRADSARVTVRDRVVDSSAYSLSSQDKEEIDQLLRKANMCVDEGHYTEPPEKSAKACLDRIKGLDPKGTYKGDEVKALIQRIIDQYFSLAEKSAKVKDFENARKWIDRAKLFHADSELIRDKAIQLGIDSTEKR